MQHLQYGMNSVSKFIIARRLPLLRGTLTSFSCLLLDRRLAIFPLATVRASDSTLRLTTRALRMIALYCIVTRSMQDMAGAVALKAKALSRGPIYKISYDLS